MLSGWDLVGAYPLKPEMLSPSLDCRWLNRGAYDLLGKSTKAKSSSNLPKAQTLYPSLPQQLKDPNSYASQLQKILKARKDYQIQLSEQVAILDVKNPALFLVCYKLYDNSLILIALNFSNESLEEQIKLPQIKFKQAKNIITAKKEKKELFSNTFDLNLKPFEAKAIVF